MTAPGSGAVVVLIGPPSAGKSSVGALLAAELGVPFADTDDLVAAAAGKPVGDIFVDDGEPVFRELERAAVARGLESAGASGRRGRPARMAASSRSAAAPCSTPTCAG